MDQATITSPRNYSEAMVRLRDRVPTMEDRPQQDLAATTIERAIKDGSISVVQAGTGVGKSNAALIPAILSGGRVVYSTATKVLQSQIVGKDLPFLAEHLGVPFTYASLKGWQSYVCHAKLAEHDGPSRQSILDAFEEDPDHSGEREAFEFDMDNREWMDLTVSTNDCPGKKECPFGAVCRPNAARDRATQATVLVVNHALLATDALVQQASDGGFSLVGPRNTLIVDEAHELEEFASGVLGDSFTEGGVRHFIGLLQGFVRRVGIGHIEVSDQGTGNEISGDDVVTEFSAAAVEFFDALKEGRLRQVDIVRNSGPYERLLFAYSTARTLLTCQATQDEIRGIEDEFARKTARAQRDRMSRQCLNKMESLRNIMLQDDTEIVRYVEKTSKMQRGHRVFTLTLKTTPVTVGPWLQENLWPLYEANILISATLLVDGSSDYIAKRLGLSGHTTLDAGTPFDYKRNALLYVPAHLPEPSGQNKTRWSIMALEETLELVNAAGGGALLLFTSNTQLQQAWDSIAYRIKFECRRQGDETNNKLMDWFRTEEHGVLFATRSFFTGASFEGNTCRLVVIDKLPFPVPTDPVFEARAEAIKRGGGNDFAELSIPMMTLPLQQGFGRLIRTKTDRGVVAILDPRLSTKSYGSKIVRSLPPATKVNDRSAVSAFFQQD